MASYLSRITTSAIIRNGRQTMQLVAAWQQGHTAGFKRWQAPTLRKLKRRKEKIGPQPIDNAPRNTFLEWNYDAEIFAFGARLNETFDEGLLRQAFTNRSYILKEEDHQKELGVENPKLNMEDNQRLVERGRTIAEDYVKGYLRAALPYFPEEGIIAVCNYLMSEDTLANVAFHLGTKDLILSSEYPPDKSTLAKTFLAILSVLEYSAPIPQVHQFIQDFLVIQLAGTDVNDLWKITNPMGILADILKREGCGEPDPRLLWQTGKNDLLATFVVGIYSDKKMLGSGPGETVDIAQEMAARDALKRLFRTQNAAPPLPLGQLANGMKVITDRNNMSVQDWSEKMVKTVVQ